MGLAQINPAVGDIDGNVDRALRSLEWADRAGAQVVVLPELAVTGYPPEDLVLKPSFVAANHRAVEQIAGKTGDLLTVVGFVDGGSDRLYNAAAICHGDRILSVYRKHLLPNYGVFDERRYFHPGRGHTLVDTPSGVIGVCICEDAWSERGPVVTQGDRGAQVVININASPFSKGKLAERAGMLGARARAARASIVYLNTVGGQDELVFDGGSLVIDPSGEIVARLPQFSEEHAIVDVPLGERKDSVHPSVRRERIELRTVDHSTEMTAPVTPELAPEQEIYDALVLALSDYAAKNEFQRCVIGLSGGIDSSLTAAIAVDALGPDAVLGVAMPSEYSSSHSIDDAKALAANLGIEMLEIPIGRVYNSYLEVLRDAFGKVTPGLAEENIQARVRGNLLMAVSNRYGHLVVATGNKSETACGYSTLYGDMAGGFVLLKDVFKAEVYALARYRNSLSPVIPESVLTKPPSAELRPGQKDTDSLPPYEILDPILEGYIENDLDVDRLVEQGHDRAIVERVVALVDRAEYKRRQAPPGPKVTAKAFGKDRRLPISNLWRHAGENELPPRAVGKKDTE
ncbi:MAG: NAD+ synthase [Actinomycetota bacterium]